MIAGGLDAGAILRLQAAAGNQAVGELLARRTVAPTSSDWLLSVQAQAVDCPPAPPPLAPASPHDDPRFKAMAGRVEREGARLKTHPPASAKVNEAERAATGPVNEVRSQAAAAQVDEMSRQKPGRFDRAAFVRAVHAAIDRSTPKTMGEVDDFTKSGKPAQLREQVVGQVGQSKDAAAKDIKGASQSEPDTSKGSPKLVTPMSPEAMGDRPADVGAAEAMPLPKPTEQVGLQHGKCETDRQLAGANVTPEQVDESNEPQFQEAMAAKKQADEHADTAPERFRQEEQSSLAVASSEAGQSAASGLAEAHQTRASAVGHVGSHKSDAKAKNEAERARVAHEVEAIYGKTRADVDQIVNDLDTKVTKAFDDGEKAARDAFENDYKTKKDEYLRQRYSGLRGWVNWLKDRPKGPPPEVNQFIVEAKKLYVSGMERVIDGVANIVETEVNRATARIQQGRHEIKEYVARQPRELRRVARETGNQISSRFDQLEQMVTDRSGALVEGLAQKYVAAAKQVDERCEAMREENKGLIDKARDKIAGMIEAIKQMKEMLSQMAQRVADVVGDIVRHPIRFLGNLIDAVKRGFGQFTEKIATHLKRGLMTWLFGEVAKAGITLPSTFDLKGILTLIAQVLGLTWDSIRARAVEVLGGRVVSLIERGAAGVGKAVEIFNTIKNEGLGGVMHLAQDKAAEIKDQALEAVKGMVIAEVISAGVKWVLSLLNPVGAFIKACKAIYDIVMFFVNHAREIADLVNTILDNLAAIVAGNISAAANLVEEALAKAIPLVIGFLASLLGLGDFGAKVRGVIDKVRQPMNVAVDWILGKVVKPIIGLVGKGVDWVKGKVQHAGTWAKRKVASAKEKFQRTFGRPDRRSQMEKRHALDSAIVESESLLARSGASAAQVRKELPSIRARHQLAALTLMVEKQEGALEWVHVTGSVNPQGQTNSAKVSSLPSALLKKLRALGLNDVAIHTIVSKKNLNAIKGELFEQLGYIVGQKMARGTALKFFAGNRFKTAQYKRQFSDGIVGILDGDRLITSIILEAKSGWLSARKLALEEGEGRPARSERYRYAVDLWREAHPDKEDLPSRVILVRYRPEVEVIASRLPREEPGQTRKDIERGVDTELLLDDRPVQLVISPKLTTIIGILPKDISGLSEALAIRANGVSYLMEHLSLSSGEVEAFAEEVMAGAK